MAGIREEGAEEAGDELMGNAEGIFSMIVILCIIGGIAFGAWNYSHQWADQGRVNWIGSKTFQDTVVSQWVTPFSIQTLHHGVINATTMGHDTSSGCGSQTGMNKNVTIGELFGVVKLNCGGYDLVNDL